MQSRELKILDEIVLKLSKHSKPTADEIYEECYKRMSEFDCTGQEMQDAIAERLEKNNETAKN